MVRYLCDVVVIRIRRGLVCPKSPQSDVDESNAALTVWRARAGRWWCRRCVVTSVWRGPLHNWPTSKVGHLHESGYPVAAAATRPYTEIATDRARGVAGGLFGRQLQEHPRVIGYPARATGTARRRVQTARLDMNRSSAWTRVRESPERGTQGSS